jgi:hypothetical protein
MVKAASNEPTPVRSENPSAPLPANSSSSNPMASGHRRMAGAEGNRPAEGPKLPKVLIVRAEQAAGAIDWVPSMKEGGVRGSEAWLANWQPPGRSDQQEAVARVG